MDAMKPNIIKEEQKSSSSSEYEVYDYRNELKDLNEDTNFTPAP